MSQRDSGYVRVPRDAYETPAWVTKALRPHIPPPGIIWEPAAGAGKMADVLRDWECPVIVSDIDAGQDFLRSSLPTPIPDSIITNPPYLLATEFIEQAISFMAHSKGLVAMLLRADFDHAPSRGHLFANSSIFSKKVVLTKRIRWFEGTKGSPSFNHAWFIWDWRHSGPPTIAYGP